MATYWEARVKTGQKRKQVRHYQICKRVRKYHERISLEVNACFLTEWSNMKIMTRTVRPFWNLNKVLDLLIIPISV